MCNFFSCRIDIFRFISELFGFRYLFFTFRSFFHFQILFFQFQTFGRVLAWGRGLDWEGCGVVSESLSKHPQIMLPSGNVGTLIDYHSTLSLLFIYLMPVNNVMLRTKKSFTTNSRQLLVIFDK